MPSDLIPSGPGWIYEVKHDGCRLCARADPGAAVIGFDADAGVGRDLREKNAELVVVHSGQVSADWQERVGEPRPGAHASSVRVHTGNHRTPAGTRGRSPAAGRRSRS